MKAFTYYQPTEIIFGPGRINNIGSVAAAYGRNCMLVTGPGSGAVAPLYEKARYLLARAGLNTVHFDRVIPNPTTDIVSSGAELAKASGCDVIIGLGGGSSMDTAKAIAVEASHEGTAWDYLCYKKQPTKKTLPIIEITTTSGTGSQVTQCAVITKSDIRDKSAIWDPNIFPRAAIIDPELMLTLPTAVTAQTGFDAFAHNFEAYISNGANPYIETLALEGIKLVLENLPAVLKDGSDIKAREAMALADTFGGLSISSAGVTLPHGLGMQISGHCPHVTHGQSLAVSYPEFSRFTYESTVGKFAKVGRIFSNELINVSDEFAAEKCCEEIDGFLKKVGLWIGFKDIGVTRDDIRSIADDGQVLPDYKNNPRVATIDEMYELLMKCYER